MTDLVVLAACHVSRESLLASAADVTQFTSVQLPKGMIATSRLIITAFLLFLFLLVLLSIAVLFVGLETGQSKCQVTREAKCL